MEMEGIFGTRQWKLKTDCVEEKLVDEGNVKMGTIDLPWIFIRCIYTYTDLIQSFLSCKFVFYMINTEITRVIGGSRQERGEWDANNAIGFLFLIET
jgi:hypothetical protein